jgi:putative transposase
MKKEKFKRNKRKSRAQARPDVFNYIETFYNPKRRHSSNGGLATTVIEEKLFESQKRVWETQVLP